MRQCRGEKAWMVVLEYSSDLEGKEGCQLAALYLRPSVSKNEMQKAMDLVLTKLPYRSNRGGQPPIHEFDRQLMRAVWRIAENYAKRELKPAILVKLAEESMKIVKRSLSRSKIWSECRAWREENKRKVKRYTTKKRDQRLIQRNSN